MSDEGGGAYPVGVIVVIGCPAYRAPDEARPEAPAGLPAAIAVAAAERGARVELVGKIGDDGTGDALVLALGRAGVGHAAISRDPVRGTPLVMLAPRVPDREPDAERDPLPADEGAAEPGPVEVVLPMAARDRPALDADDVELALRYLGPARVLVAADPLDEQTAAVVAEARRFSGAHLVAIVPSGGSVPSGFEDATLLEAPAEDEGDAFGRVVGVFAAGIEAGGRPEVAFRDAVRSGGWEAAEA